MSTLQPYIGSQVADITRPQACKTGEASTSKTWTGWRNGLNKDCQCTLAHTCEDSPAQTFSLWQMSFVWSGCRHNLHIRSGQCDGAAGLLTCPHQQIVPGTVLAPGTISN